MKISEYQIKSKEFDLNKNIAYYFAGLAGESGEVVEEFAKSIRDDDGFFTEKRLLRLRDELGDVLWFVATLARKFNWDLEEIAGDNIIKLSGRKEMKTIMDKGRNETIEV